MPRGWMPTKRICNEQRGPSSSCATTVRFGFRSPTETVQAADSRLFTVVAKRQAG